MARFNGTAGRDVFVQGLNVEVEVFTFAGNDRITLNRTDDSGGFNIVDAGNDNDEVFNLFEGGNEINLGSGTDRYEGTGFAGGSGSVDRVFGGAGNDTIAVTTFHSSYFGEADNDTFFTEGWQNFFDGGAGTDRLSFELRDLNSTLDGTGVIVDVAQGFANTGGQRIEEFANIENINTTNGIDEIYGSAAANVLRGLGSNDLIVGRGGNDTLEGGSGADEMIGGAGNDTYIVDNINDVVDELNDGGSGADTVQSSVSFNLTPSSRVGGSIENLVLTGTGAINATGNNLANTLTGNVGNNTLDGSGSADTMIGGAGNDTYVVQDVNDKIDEAGNGGAGTDLVRSSVNFSLVASSKLLGSVEKLTLTGSANINGSGNNGVNTLTGNTGNNTLDGAGAADTMIGGAGNDTYVVQDANDIVDESSNGGAGNDTVKSSISFSLVNSAKVLGTVENLSLAGTGAINGTGNNAANVLNGNTAANTLSGGGNNDSLSGGLGNDILTGGAGADNFRFNTALNATSNVDRITDFNTTDDTIRLEDAIFTAIVGTGTLTAAQFVKNTTGLAADANDRIVYETDTGKLFYDSNGSASGGSLHFATVGTNLAVTNADFFVI